MAFKLNLILLSLSLVVAVIRADHRSYNIIAFNETELKFLQQFETISDYKLFFDYKWRKRILQMLLENDYKRVDVYNSLVGTSSYNWNHYYQLGDTYQWLQQLAAKNPGIVTLIEAGQSYWGRLIMGVKISKSKSEKPGIFIEAGAHALEWIAPATATFLINQLLYSKVASIQQAADNYNWYIFPHVNPDGYVYTHTTDRYWRKTRTPYGSCFGADLNRNWDIHWQGGNDSSCSEVYAGPYAFSEIEARSVASYLKSLHGKISMYISFHAFGQRLLFPYAHTFSLPSNYGDLKQVFNVGIDAISKRYGTRYTGGNIYNAIYPASGSSIDWVFENAGTKMVFCYELRPSVDEAGSIGFDLPPSDIEATGEETVDSIVAMVNKAQELGYFDIK